MVEDYLESPLYPLAEAARLAGTTASALARWAEAFHVKRHYVQDRVAAPLIIAPPQDGTRLLSFLNLIEAHFIVAYRQSGVSLRSIQVAVEYARNEFGDQHPLRKKAFKTNGRHLFRKVEEEEGLSGLIVFSAAGQLAWPGLVAQFFESVDYDRAHRPIRWWPMGHERSILCDPRFAFGYPVVSEKFVRTDVLAERFQAGERVEEIALDFGVERTIIEDAVRYELSLKAA